MTLYRFSSLIDLAEGLVVTEDLQPFHRKLLRFLAITPEYQDYVIIRKEPDSQGVWQ
jgi:hypothetical protein